MGALNGFKSLASLILRTKILRQEYFWTSFPGLLQIDTNNHCGPKYSGIFCEYCYPQWRIINGYKKYSEMPMEQIEWICRQMGKYGEQMSGVSLFLNGDALTETRLPEIVRLVKKFHPNLPTISFTCGANSKNKHLLVESKIDWMSFTLSAHTPELYRKVHRGNKFHEALETMRYFYENKTSKQLMDIHFVITKHNFPYMREWYSFIGKEFPGVRRMFSPLVASFDNKPSLDALGNLTLQQQEDAIYKIDPRPEANFWPKIAEIGLRMPCVLWSNAAVEADGTLLQCCNWADSREWNYGNISDFMREGKNLRDDYWIPRLKNKMNNPLCESCNMKHPNWKKRLSKIRFTKVNGETRVKLKVF